MTDHKGPKNEFELSDAVRAEYGLPIPPKRNPKLKPFPPKVLAGQFGGKIVGAIRRIIPIECTTTLANDGAGQAED